MLSQWLLLYRPPRRSLSTCFSEIVSFGFLLPGRLLPAGAWLSIPLFILPCVLFVGNSSFQNRYCLSHIRPSPFGRGNHDERDTRCIVSELKWTQTFVVSNHSSENSPKSMSSSRVKSSGFPAISHPSISLFAHTFVCVWRQKLGNWFHHTRSRCVYFGKAERSRRKWPC